MLPPFDTKALVVGAQVARAFIQAHRIAYAHINPDLRVNLASPNFSTLLSDASRELQGTLLPDLLWEFVGCEEILQSILDGIEPAYWINNVNRELPDGSTMYLNFYVSPFDDANPGTGLLLIIEDITNKCQLEQKIVQDRNQLRLAQAQLAQANNELERLNRFKSIMLSMAAHEIRSPLGVIMLYTEMIRDELGLDSDPRQNFKIDMILSQVNGLNALINNMLSLDQAEQGRLLINFTPCRLDELIDSVICSLSVLADASKLQIKASLPSNPVVVMADPERLKQVLNNLIVNAIKYTPKGGEVNVSMRCEADQAILDVSDTGRGMTPEEIKRLFQPYYRTPDAEFSKIPGSGLGLFIARTLVEAHKGTISVSSQSGKGTTFRVILPLIQ